MSVRALTLSGTGFAAGDLILGKYRVDRLLGKGGMGFVLAATHVGLDQQVAIKMLLPAVAMRVDVVARFSREARAAARLKSEHVVRVMDVGTLDGGAPYLVMEYLRGRDLEQILEQKGPVPIGDAVEWVLQACEALAEAHARGVVHRDLKPSNLFLAQRADGSEVVKLLDFGISKATTKSNEEEQSLTGLDVLMGSPRYMSPEQLRSARDVDGRTDIWSLGVILYQLIAGKCPFDAETTPKLIAQLASEPPVPIEKVKSGVPPALCRAIAKCLEKDLERRYTTVRELAGAIAPFAAKADVAARLARIERAAAPSLEAAIAIEAEVVPEIEKVALRVAQTQAFAEDFAPTLAQPTGAKKYLGVLLGALLLLSIGAAGAAFWHARKVSQEVEHAVEILFPRQQAARTASATIAAPAREEPVRRNKLKRMKKKRAVTREPSR